MWPGCCCKGSSSSSSSSNSSSLSGSSSLLYGGHPYSDLCLCDAQAYEIVFPSGLCTTYNALHTEYSEMIEGTHILQFYGLDATQCWWRKVLEHETNDLWIMLEINRTYDLFNRWHFHLHLASDSNETSCDPEISGKSYCWNRMFHDKKIAQFSELNLPGGPQHLHHCEGVELRGRFNSSSCTPRTFVDLELEALA